MAMLSRPSAYTPPGGNPALREVVARHLSERSLRATEADETVLTTSASGAIAALVLGTSTVPPSVRRFPCPVELGHSVVAPHAVVVKAVLGEIGTQDGGDPVRTVRWLGTEDRSEATTPM